jgi:tRNA pseudouridine32 synthase/23S rRNA pseudouridine746 synthase
MLHGTDALASPNQQRSQTLCAQIETIYEDAYLQVVNKPAGLLSVPGKTREVSVAEYLSERQKNPYLRPVHRLDQDTSGLLVLAKSPEIYTTLQAYFQRRDILKRYEALVELSSQYHAMEGIIDLPLLPNPLDRPRQMVDHAHGKPAITRYCIRERRENNIALVDFYPLTGRTHQLRVHAAHPEGLNAPIVGDRLYGKGQGERLMLHAAEIVFTHPITQKEMHFFIPMAF